MPGIKSRIENALRLTGHFLESTLEINLTTKNLKKLTGRHTSYFVSLALDGQQAELELNSVQYRLISELKKFKRGQILPRDERNPVQDIVDSINKISLKQFGKSIIMESAEGYILYRSIAELPKRVFGILNGSIYYRGVEVPLTDKQIKIVTALAAAPDRSMTFQDLANAVGWNGRNYRTNVRSYMEEVNIRTFLSTGAELLLVEGRGKAIRLNTKEPSGYGTDGYSRVNGQILNLQGSAFAVAEIISGSIREELPARKLTISQHEMITANLSTAGFFAAMAAIYRAAGININGLRINLQYGTSTFPFRFDEAGRAFESGRSLKTVWSLYFETQAIRLKPNYYCYLS